MAAQPFNNGNGFLANPPSVWGAPHSFMSDLSDDDDELQGKCNIGLAEVGVLFLGDSLDFMISSRG